MHIERAPEEFRPITVTLETQDELDQLVAILGAVSRNTINHTPTLIRAATDMMQTLVSTAYPGA